MGFDAPRIYIIAGPNGAGKTTFAKDYLPNVAHCPVFVNADLIAAGIAPFAPESVAMAAGRLMLREIDTHVAARRSFGFETTLAGRGYALKIEAWKELGYWVEMHFITLPDALTAQQRVALRVAQGGHSIPSNVIARRFAAGIVNFENVYKPLVGEWFLYDGNSTPPSRISRGVNYD